MSAEERYELALRRIMGTRCENLTTGIGSCFGDGRQIVTQYGADQVCDACVAWAALFPWERAK